MPDADASRFLGPGPEEVLAPADLAELGSDAGPTAETAAGVEAEARGVQEEGSGDDAVDPAAAAAARASAPPAGPAEAGGARAVPWLISLLAHAVLILVSFFVVWSVKQVFDDDEVVVPLVRLSETPGARPLVVTPRQRLDTPPPTAAAVPAPPPTPEASPLDIEIDLELPAMGDPSLSAAPSFELTLADAAEFDTEFFGSGGNARDIVFVLEADGSIIADYPQIVAELAESLRSLSPKQRFSVIVFDGQGTKEVPPRGLKRATGDAIGGTLRWLRPEAGNVENFGPGEPVPALERAFELRPELIFLLSQNLYNPGRGPYERQRAAILEAVQSRARRRAVINTLEFNDLDRLALDAQGNKVRATLLEEIAQRTGGEYLWLVTNEPNP
ncbi:MAG: hypothetical protein AAGG38_13565 [Planctomycetota bacterium]